MSVNYSVTAATLPAELACLLTDEQWQSLVQTLTVELPNGSRINIGNTTPTPANRVWPWFRTNADGTPDRTYLYALGSWLSRHPMPPGMVTMWEGAEVDIPTYDGGEAGAVTVSTGPFWERVTQMDAKFPIGPGTTPVAPTGTGAVIAVGATGGEEIHTLTADEIPDGQEMFNNNNLTGLVAAVGSSSGTYQVTTVGTGTSHRTISWQGGGDAHNNMPLYRAIWFLRRTGRLYHRAP